MRAELTRFPLVKRALVSRWPLLAARVITLAGFAFTIATGLAGSPVGSHNFAIIFVWIAWWSVLKLIAIPLGGRSWCSVCPIPMAGEWMQQGGLLGPGDQNIRLGDQATRQGRKTFTLGRKWPRQLNHTWLQTASFAAMGMFSAVILTRPEITAWALLGLILLATGLGIVFERRAFCRHICPVGGFVGLYARLAPLEVRVKDPAICAAHTEKTCYTGSQQGYGCPWGNFPAALTQSATCGLCMECLRTCPHDNMALNLRSFGADLATRSQRRLDEAFFGFVMLGSALVYSAVMLGPWGWLKAAAYNAGSAGWLVYALAFLAFVLVATPGLFYLAVSAGKRFSGLAQSTRKTFTALALAILPLGLMGWIAFTLSFAFAKLAYVWPVLSDPFGWGWNLLGTAHLTWSPYLTTITPTLQAAALLVGLVWSCKALYRMARENLLPHLAARLALPAQLYCLVFTFGMLWLLLA